MYRRPCWVEISTGAFEDNYRLLAASSGGSAATPDSVPNFTVELLAIVKADAYGHALSLCAPAAMRAGARWLGVTSVEEGVAARAFSIAAGFPEVEILVIAGPFAGQGAEVVAHRLTAVVWEHWQLDELEAAALAAACGAGTVAVHLELDTGMSRQGVGAADLDGILARFVAGGTPLKLDGLMTHLYAADERDGEATRGQFALLEPMVERVRDFGLRPACLHVGNSAAVLLGDVPRALQSLCRQFGLKPMARPGLALYGRAPSLEPVGVLDGVETAPNEPTHLSRLSDALKPVLEWKTRVVSLRKITAEQVVGYNGTFVATEPMCLALLAVGYADGLNRALSNRGSVLAGGQAAPIVGRISMDQTVVDVTGIPDVAPGDEVVLLGRQGAGSITVDEHAAWAGTIPWAIFTSITARVERIEV